MLVARTAIRRIASGSLAPTRVPMPPLSTATTLTAVPIPILESRVGHDAQVRSSRAR